LHLVFERLQYRRQFGRIILNDALERVIVASEVAVNQPVAGGDDHPPGDFGMCGARLGRNMGGCFAGHSEHPLKHPHCRFIGCSSSEMEQEITEIPPYQANTFRQFVRLFGRLRFIQKIHYLSSPARLYISETNL